MPLSSGGLACVFFRNVGEGDELIASRYREAAWRRSSPQVLGFSFPSTFPLVGTGERVREHRCPGPGLPVPELHGLMSFMNKGALAMRKTLQTGLSLPPDPVHRHQDSTIQCRLEQGR